MPLQPDVAPTPGARNRILESAVVLLRQSGLSGAGINQLLAHSGAPKGSMYYHFPGGKLQIAAQALELYGQRVATSFETALSSRKKPADKLRALFGLIAARFENANFEQSCAAGAVALDLQAPVAALQPVVAGVMAAWQLVVARHLPQRTIAQRQSFAGLVISAIEGAYIRGRAERSATALVEAGEWLARMLEAQKA